MSSSINHSHASSAPKTAHKSHIKHPVRHFHWHSSKGGADIKAVTTPNYGTLIFQAEGKEGGPNASRYLYVPSLWSGLTIGRGYDMKKRSAEQIVRELTSASVGVSMADAIKLSKAAGKHGATAAEIGKTMENFSLSPEQQLALFRLTYTEESKTIANAYAHAVAKHKDAVSFSNLDPAIQNIIIDLKYVGQYVPRRDAELTKAIAHNNLQAVRDAVNKLNKKGYEGRYASRLSELDNAIIERNNSKSLGDNKSVLGTPPPPRRGGVVVG